MKFSFFTLLLAAQSAIATDHFWTTPINSDLQSVAISNDVPLGPYGFYTYSFGSELQKHSQWNVGEFSGLTSPMPMQNYQASTKPNGYGSTSVQLIGHQATMHLHSWSLPSPSPMGWYILTWNRPVNANPWSASFGSDPIFCVEHSQAIVASYSEGTPQYTGVSVWLSDKNGRFIQLEVKSWDNRGPQSFYEGVSYDPGLDSNYAGTYYSSGRRYITLMSYSNSANNEIWAEPRWYGMCISKGNLANIVNERNAKVPGSPPLDGDYSKYTVTNVVVQAEIAGLATPTKPGSNGWFTLRAAGIYTYTRY